MKGFILEELFWLRLNLTGFGYTCTDLALITTTWCTGLDRQIMEQKRVGGGTAIYLISALVYEQARIPEQAPGLSTINFRNQNHFWITNLTFLDAPAAVTRSVYAADGSVV